MSCPWEGLQTGCARLTFQCRRSMGTMWTQLRRPCTSARAAGRYSVVFAHTVKGRGTGYEGTVESHYLPLPAADRDLIGGDSR